MYNNDLIEKANVSLLTANTNTAQLTFLNNKYGFTINEKFYPIGGSTMKSKLYSGSFSSSSNTISLDTAFGGHFDSADDYFVILTTREPISGESLSIANKSATTITLAQTSSGAINGSIQIVYSENNFIEA